MRQYHFSDPIMMNKNKAIVVENDQKKQIGYIEKAEMPGCEKGNTFSFIVKDEGVVTLGIQKRSIKDIIVPTYKIKTNFHEYKLRDKFGNNLLYFSVVGEIAGDKITIDE